MEVRRSGNFGFVDPGNGSLYSFDISGRGKGWDPSSIMLNHNRNTCFTRKMSVAGYDIVPMGDNNDMPGEVMRLLDRFYAGEGILGKIAGLQWGDGPRFYHTHAGLLYQVCPQPCAPYWRAGEATKVGAYPLPACQTVVPSPWEK